MLGIPLAISSAALVTFACTMKTGSMYIHAKSEQEKLEKKKGQSQADRYSTATLKHPGIVALAALALVIAPAFIATFFLIPGLNLHPAAMFFVGALLNIAFTIALSIPFVIIMMIITVNRIRA